MTAVPAAPETPAPATSAGRRAADRADALERRLAEKRLLLATTQQQIVTLEGQLRSWRAGAEGERRVAVVLDALAADGWVALHDVRWPGRERANLDHVVVGPGGVVVVDAKNWSSEVTVRDGVLRAGGYRKTRECVAAAAMAGAVAALVEPAHRTAVWSVLCLAGHDAPAARVDGGAVVVGLGQLAPLLRAMPVRLSPGDVALLAVSLRRELTAPTPPQLTTTAALGSPALAAALPPPPPQRSPRRTARPSARRAPLPLGAGAALVGGTGLLALLVGRLLGWS